MLNILKILIIWKLVQSFRSETRELQYTSVILADGESMEPARCPFINVHFMNVQVEHEKPFFTKTHYFVGTDIL